MTSPGFVDGQAIYFEFDGIPVGRITRFTILDGITPDVVHKSMSRPYPVYRPGLVVHGLLTLYLFRDYEDPGQQRMDEARNNSETVDCIFKTSSGIGFTFPGFVKKLPLIGSDNGLGTADAVIRVAGKLVPAQ